MKKVKGEGRKTILISFFLYKYKFICSLFFLEQEYRNPSFTFTHHHPPGSQVGQVPKTEAIFCAFK